MRSGTVQLHGAERSMQHAPYYKKLTAVLLVKEHVVNTPSPPDMDTAPPCDQNQRKIIHHDYITKNY